MDDDIEPSTVVGKSNDKLTFIKVLSFRVTEGFKHKNSSETTFDGKGYPVS